MTVNVDQPTRAPRFVSLFSSVLQRMLAAGVPVGPNALITIPGRKTGEPRTAGVAIIEVGGRRWIWAPWGEVNWVRNLRAAGRATLTKRGRKEEVRATELNPAERVHFFRDVLTGETPDLGALSAKTVADNRYQLHSGKAKQDLCFGMP